MSSTLNKNIDILNDDDFLINSWNYISEKFSSYSEDQLNELYDALKSRLTKKWWYKSELYVESILGIMEKLNKILDIKMT